MYARCDIAAAEAFEERPAAEEPVQSGVRRGNGYGIFRIVQFSARGRRSEIR
jgi:hypothetical protein